MQAMSTRDLGDKSPRNKTDQCEWLIKLQTNKLTFESNTGLTVLKTSMPFHGMLQSALRCDADVTSETISNHTKCRWDSPASDERHIKLNSVSRLPCTIITLRKLA